MYGDRERFTAVAVVAAVSILLTGAAAASGNTSLVYVVDSGRNSVAVIETEPGPGLGAHRKVSEIFLDEGPAGSFDPAGVAFSTLPADPGGFAFVTQGRFLRVIDVHKQVSPIEHTVDVGTLIGDTSLRLAKLDGAPSRLGPVPEQYDAALYLVGSVLVSRGFGAGGDGPGPPSHREPYYVILDQQKLIVSGGGDPSVVLDHGLFCPQSPGC